MTLPSEVLGTLEHLFFELMEHRNTSKKLSKNWNQFGEEISTRPDISSKSKFFECGQDFQENKSFSFPPWIKTRWSNFHQPLSFTNEVYIFRIKWSMRVNYRISYAKEVQYPSYQTHETLFSYHIYNRFKFQPKQNFMHFLGSSAILSWTFQKMHEMLLWLKFEAVVDVIWK